MTMYDVTAGWDAAAEPTRQQSRAGLFQGRPRNLSANIQLHRDGLFWIFVGFLAGVLDQRRVIVEAVSMMSALHSFGRGAMFTALFVGACYE